MLQFLHKISRGERKFLIREYQIIKNNAKVELCDRPNIITINLNCRLPQGARPRASIWDPIASRWPRAFASENEVTLHLDYAYALGYPFTVPADFMRILQSPSHAINIVEVSVAIKTLSSQVFHVI